MLTDKPVDIGLDSKSPAERDRIDLNHEISGEPTGRIQRFLSGGSTAYTGETKKKKAEREYRTLLEMLLAEDPQYAALYRKVTKKLEKAQQAVGQVLIDTNQRLEASDRKLQILRGNAAELQDGTKVFQSTDNNSIYTEQGKRLNNEEAQDIEFSDNAPSWEAYRAEKESYDTAMRQKAEVETYQQDVLEVAKERINDKENPLSLDELEELETRIEDEMPDIMRSNYNNDVLTSNTIKGSSSISAAHDLTDKKNLTFLIWTKRLTWRALIFQTLTLHRKPRQRQLRRLDRNPLLLL